MTSILIFGGSGSLGKALIRRYLNDQNVSSLNVYSRDEAKHWSLLNEFSRHPRKSILQFHVGDIRDEKRVFEVMMNVSPQTVIIAAAMKQVDTCEKSPGESILTNIVGVQNVVKAANDCSRHNSFFPPMNVLFVSTDKCASPVNVYGMCKAISERYVTSFTKNVNVKFMAVRYGNVLDSRGSILPLFRYQAESCPEFTVTDPDMTRFLMTLDESVDLINTTLKLSKPGDVWIPRLRSMKIGDLAEIFSKAWKKPIKIIGHRPGEKMHEVLINSTESTRVIDFGEKYRVIKQIDGSHVRKDAFEYTSADDVMSKSELYSYLHSIGMFEKTLEEFEGKSIEEIRTGDLT